MRRKTDNLFQRYNDLFKVIMLDGVFYLGIVSSQIGMS